jgi:hypothetical protein
MVSLAIWPILLDSWGEITKERRKSLNFEAKNRAFEN